MKKFLGIELGSTRIKAVLTDERAAVLASGEYGWENGLTAEGLWTYSLDEAWAGLRKSYSGLAADYQQRYGEKLENIAAIGISGMMHGYLALDKSGSLLSPFLTWRNTNTAAEAEELSKLFNFHVPMRWSVSQYYKHFKSGSAHLKNVDFITTLPGYIHFKLTGQKALGVGDASGMFPVSGCEYNGAMLEKFNNIIGFDFKSLLPRVMPAGRCAGVLTEEGAKLLDPSGGLKAGIPLCPPEGDMATGMVCTNAVARGTANISSGTCANLTVVLGRPLKHYYSEIDIISTPEGLPAALIHTNNCTTEINEWVRLFGEVAQLAGAEISQSELIEKLFKKSLESDKETGGVISYNFLAGEPLAGTAEGAPMIFRSSAGKFSLANFMQAQVYSAIAALSLGADILKREDIRVTAVTAHGGFYKTEFVGQNATSALVGAPVTVMDTAGEGGAWGIALLAIYLSHSGRPLAEFLEDIFSGVKKTTVTATPAECAKFNSFIKNYHRGLAAELAASRLNGAANRCS